MAIVIGGGGGSGDGVPTGAIITTGKDMTEEGYGSLKTDLVLDKANEPDLWEIYKEEAGNWSEIYSNVQGEEDVYRVGDELFMKMTNHSPVTISFFKDFSGYDLEDYALPFVGNTNGEYSTFKSAIPGQLLFMYSNILYLVDYDHEAATSADAAASCTVRIWDIGSEGEITGELALTKDRIYNVMLLSNIRVYYTDSRFGDISEAYSDDFSQFGYQSDQIAEKFITVNGWYLNRGKVCDPLTGDQKTISIDDHQYDFVYFHKDGKDYYSYNGNLGIIDENFNLEIKTIPNISTRNVVDYFDDNNVLMGSTYQYYNGKTEGGVYSSITQRTILLTKASGSPWDKRAQSTLKFSGGTIGFDPVSYNVYFMKYLSEAPDIFTIDSVDSISTDKESWIKLEQKGL